MKRSDRTKMKRGDQMRIGILSDTHDLLRPEAEQILRGCDHILHAGDVGSKKIIERLEKCAPVSAVQGNNDKGRLDHLPFKLEIELGGLRFFMTHKKKDLPEDLSSYDLVIYGHSHQYASSWGGTAGGKRMMLLNPGSCGPRRFNQPVTMAVLTVEKDGWSIERIDLPHTPGEAVPKKLAMDVRQQIESVVRETQKGHLVPDIAKKYHMDEALTEQIARLYLTHPGVDVDGIMTKMGL